MDHFDIVILPDGTVKSSSGPVSPENHQSAEAFLKMLAALTGGTTTRRARGDTEQHHAHVVPDQTHSHG
jgi:hypothetical protein